MSAVRSVAERVRLRCHVACRSAEGRRRIIREVARTLAHADAPSAERRKASAAPAAPTSRADASLPFVAKPGWPPPYKALPPPPKKKQSLPCART
jgi:hypothetical protein